MAAKNGWSSGKPIIFSRHSQKLVARCESGSYGGRPIRFLGLGDLIRSKETERASDWQDIALLEEIRDERNIAAAKRTGDFTWALIELRSRKGFETLFAADHPPRDVILTAVAAARNPVTVAYLAPFLAGSAPPTFEGMIGEVIAGPLLKVEPLTARHLALVEAIRRLYKQNAMAADRADKEIARRGS